MKYCDEYLPALSAFVDGELNEAERDKVLAHLETCGGCRDYLAELAAMHAAFEGMEEYDAPEGFADGVMARLHETAAPKKRTHRTAWVSLAACAALVVVVLGTPLREQFGAGKLAADSAAPETAMLTMAAPQMAECAEEEYEDNYASVQNAPRTMVTMDSAPKNDVLTGAGDYKEKVSEENGVEPETGGFEAPVENAIGKIGEADADANDASFANEAELPRSVVFVYGAAREDYLIEAAVSFDHYADGTVAGYDLPREKLDEFLTLLDADGVPYDSSVAKQATTFYVQYEEAGANG